jgi:uncharacterized protein
LLVTARADGNAIEINVLSEGLDKARSCLDYSSAGKTRRVIAGVREEKDGAMFKAVARAFCIVLVTLAVGSTANASQLRKGLAAFQRSDFTRAATLLRLPAKQGNPQAQAVLCFLYTYGRGVPQSYDEAAFWCVRSAEQGNTEGQYQLGLLFNKGHGVPENYVQAYKWLNLAAARASGSKKDFSYRIRDAVASKMSPKQIAKAQRLAVAFRPIAEVPGSVVIVPDCAVRKACYYP